MALIGSLSATSAAAQPALDRILGPSESGSPITISAVNGGQFETLTKAARVAAGFEGMLPVRTDLSILATGKSLRDVLDAMTAADPRYEWRWDNEVIVFRPIERWHDGSSALHARIGGFSLDNINAGDALALLARMVGVWPVCATTDARRFSVNVGDGATWLEALNSIVRAHGSLTWVIAPSLHYSAGFPISLYLGGAGFGIPAGAVLRPTVGEPDRPCVATSAEPAILDRVVGTTQGVDPLLVESFYSLVPSLANAVGVPIGFQSLPADERAVILNDPINLTGLTLREALDALVAVDPRYHWQELNGVIVVRPVRAWLDSQDPLFRSIRSVHLQDVQASKPIDLVLAALGRAEASGFPDTRLFSISLPEGPLLDLLNEMSRQHGELSWVWREIPPNEKNDYPRTYRYEITFYLRGFGSGFAVP